jgi:hypothetical protein
VGLLLIGEAAGRSFSPRRLSADEEKAVIEVSRALVAYSVSVEQAVVVHERHDGHRVGWNREGAIELAKALPPAFAALSHHVANAVASDAETANLAQAS